MRLHLVEDLDLVRGQERAQLSFHLFVKRLHLGKIGAQDRFELGTVALGDLVRFHILGGRKVQRAWGSGKKRRVRSRRVQGPEIPVRQTRASNCPK